MKEQGKGVKRLAVVVVVSEAGEVKPTNWSVYGETRLGQEKESLALFSPL